MASASDAPTKKKEKTSALQVLIGPNAVLLSLPEFLATHVPQLAPLPQVEDARTLQLLQTLRVSPFNEMPCLVNVYGRAGKPINTESLSSLVDHVVWSLVQRREQLRRNKQDGRNLLCQGFVVASEELVKSGAQSMRNMPPGILLMQMNSSVEFVKASALFRLLHVWLGDSVLRLLLLNCRIFLPIGNDEKRENYWQVAGPPLRMGTRIESSLPPKRKHPSTTTKGARRKRRRRAASTSTSLAPKLCPSATILTNPLLHSNSHVPRVGLPTNHVLNRSSANDLLGDMFDLRGRNGKVNKKRWKRLRNNGLGVCEKVVQNHAKCDYARLLEHYCPLSSILTESSQEKVDIASVSAAFTAPQAVSSFLKSVIKRVLTDDVWGCPQNQDRVMKLVDGFVHARRHEHFPNTQLVQGIRVKQMEWLRADPTKKFSRSNEDATKQLVLLLLRWTLEKFVIPLASACFHVTETEFTGNRLVYYRKPVWALFRSLSMKKLLTSQYNAMTTEEAAARQDQQRMGFSRLRLVPKTTGVRPIATLSKAVHVTFADTTKTTENRLIEADDHMDISPTPKRHNRNEEENAGAKKLIKRWVRPTNVLLNEAFAVLRFEYEQDVSLFGSGLDGLHHFYPRYRRFIEEVQPRSNPSRKLFFGSVDIRHCFDSIDQEEMLKIVQTILNKDDYCIQNHSQYRPFESMSRLLKIKKTIVGPPEEIKTFQELADELATSSHKTVYADTGNCNVSKSEQVMKMIEEHLKSHLVVTSDRHGDRYLVQSKGVPQGSTLSTLLCNFYYGRIESRLFNTYDGDKSTEEPPTHIVCRQVDDFIYVGTRRHLLQKFLAVMLEGDRDMGVQVNEDKTQVSTTIVVRQGEGNTETLKPSGSPWSFPWCGMVFDVTSGEVMNDYTRFYGGKAGNSISIDRSRGPGEEMLVQLKTFVRPRCMPILFDRCINRPAVQRKNLFQMMAFAAVKLVLYIQARGASISSDAHVSHLIKSVDAAIIYAGILIESRLKASNAHCDITAALHKYIGWKAFQAVFGSCTRAGKVILALNHKVKAHDCADECVNVICQGALRSMNLRELLSDGQATMS
eukprot:scaffold2655_cov179-Amphora_coffeaeformis.AAC.4